MVDGVTDSDDSDKFDWESDGEAEPTSAPSSRNFNAPGPSTLDINESANGTEPSPALVGEYVGMGFQKEMVLKGIKEIGYGDANALIELLLTYKALSDGGALVGDCSTSVCVSQGAEDDDDDFDFENWDDSNDAGGRELDSDSSGGEDFLNEMSERDKKIKSLVDMGFPDDKANMAVTNCSVDAAIDVLVDSIYAPETAGIYHSSSRDLFDHEVMVSKKKRKLNGGGARRNQASLDGSHGEESMSFPNPMIGFSLPNYRTRSVNRRIPEVASGPPFFYYENVARAPKDTWTTISRYFHDIEPEFVDSQYMSAANRKRGYIHNLPIENRFPLLPLPPKTIFEAFPHYKQWWPSWDPRRQFNCLQTSVATLKLVGQIHCALSRCGDPPPPDVQRHVVEECKKWNLVWIGKNKVAPLEPHEFEFLLGFPRDHTRGVSKTERYRSLGNSFHVDTVAYHLSVLRDMYPNGMNVLSLFTGIGGGEVALHRLGIRMKTVVSVEISDVNRRILRGWWDQTQGGQLIEITDVKTLTCHRIESYVRRFRGFDLVIGGSPCNNLTGSNRYNRDGLEGEQSSLFYYYPRILNDVKSAMARL